MKSFDAGRRVFGGLLLAWASKAWPYLPLFLFLFPLSSALPIFLFLSIPINELHPAPSSVQL
jgi:hypothetical protein